MSEYEPWRLALIAFYTHDEMPMKAWRLSRGADFDYLDIRTIEALKAAVRLAA